jgi:hypothetical protein
MPLFTTNWKESEDRRELILKNLAEVCECMTQGLETTMIIDMMDRRERRLEDWRKADQSQTHSRLQSVLAWLDVKDGQEDELDRLCGLQYEGSCSWVFANNKIRRWREAGRENPVVWLTGKPGAGILLAVTPRLILRLTAHREKRSFGMCYPGTEAGPKG